MNRPILVRSDSLSIDGPESEPTTILGEFSQNLPAWLTSLVWHLTLIIVLGLLTIGGKGFGNGGGTGIAIDVGGANGMGGNDLTSAEAISNGESVPLSSPLETRVETPELAQAITNQIETLPSLELQGIQPSASALATPARQGAGRGHGDGHGDGQGDGDGIEGGGGLGLLPATTQIFGLAAEGTRFVYVFDRSESMTSVLSYTSEGSTVFSITPLAAAKAELLRSLEDLNPRQRFQLVFYNHMATVFEPARGLQRLIAATKDNKRRAGAFVSRINGEGGTYHLEPLEIALGMRPDVIFLLTDGEAKDDPSLYHVTQLTRMNRSRAKINVIQFCFAPRDDGTLVQLAKENGGQHVFYNISRLGPGLPNGPRNTQPTTTPPLEPPPLPERLVP